MFFPICRICINLSRMLQWQLQILFLNGSSSASFKFITILTTNKCEKCPSRMHCWDSNSRPLEQESPHITTRPGLPPIGKSLHSGNLGVRHCFLLKVIDIRDQRPRSLLTSFKIKASSQVG